MDPSKLGANFYSNSDQRVAEDFAALRQANAKAVQIAADSSKTNKDNHNSQSFGSSSKKQSHNIEAMNKQMSQLNVQLTFEMTDDRKKNIVKVLDQTTGDVVRQMPTEEFLKMSERIDAIMDQLSDIKGALVNNEA